MTKFGTISQGGFWLNGWEYGKKITVPKSKVDADLTNFPLTVYLNDTNFDFIKAETDGKDIRFTDKDKNHLTFERVEHNAVHSAYFDGSGDYLALGGQSDFAFGTGDFCIEVKYISTKLGTDTDIYDSRPISTNGAYFRLMKRSDNKITFYTHGVVQITSDTIIVPNIEYTIVVKRKNGITKLYINNSKEGIDYTDSANYLNGANRPVFGSAGYTYTNYLDGYLKGLRVTKGRSRDGEPIPDKFEIDGSDVAFCTNFDKPLVGNTFTDDTGKTVTAYGDVKILPPFAHYNVKIPTVSNTEDTEIYMWHGNTSATDTANTTGDVWDDNYVMVQHMGDSLVDATGNGNNGTATGTTVVDTEFGKARSFNGTSNRIAIANEQNFEGLSGITVSALYSMINTANDQIIISKWWDGSNRSFSLGHSTSDALNFRLSTDSTHGNYYAKTPTIFETNNAISGKWSGDIDNISIYDNGILANTTALAGNTTRANNTPVQIGADNYAGTLSSWFKGIINAVRISDIARSDAWIKAESLALKNELIKFSSIIKSGVDGETVEPVNDYTVWLKCADIPNTFGSLANVIADAGAMDTLSNEENAVNYMVRSSAIMTAVIASSTAMTAVAASSTTIDLIINNDVALYYISQNTTALSILASSIENTTTILWESDLKWQTIYDTLNASALFTKSGLLTDTGGTKNRSGNLITLINNALVAYGGDFATSITPAYTGCYEHPYAHSWSTGKHIMWGGHTSVHGRDNATSTYVKHYMFTPIV